MSEPKYRKLKWTVEFFNPKRTGRPKTAKGGVVGPGAFYAVRGRLPASLPVLYVVLVEAGTKHVIVPMIGWVGDLASTVRIPQAGACLRSVFGGTIQVVTADRFLTLDELAGIVGGETPPGSIEPMPIGTSGGST
jgi:hypothetical protein